MMGNWASGPNKKLPYTETLRVEKGKDDETKMKISTRTFDWLATKIYFY